MKNALASFVVGFIFAIGLGVSGMTDPKKVQGFLDLFHQFNPALIFVMMGAIGVHAILYKLVRTRKSPMLDDHWHVPTKKEITPALIIGSLMFGFGWALAGMCPGPAVVNLASFQPKVLVFVISMFIGMLAMRQIENKFKFNK